MNAQLVGELIRLRYKLMWAKTRSRNGKMVLFFIGYLLLSLLAALLIAGGLGAGIAAVRSGKAELITKIVLTSLFAQALFATLMMGFGMSAIFSDVELRRYPVSAGDRRLVRHLIGIIDPFWLLTLALELGLVVGLYVLDATGFGTGLIAVLLLLVANYLTARVVGDLVDRMMRGPSGSAVMFVILICLSFSGAIVPPLMKRFPGLGGLAAQVFSWTPPFGAAVAMTRSGAGALTGFAVEIAWVVGLAVTLVALEHRPPRRKVAQTTVLSFDNPYDRFTAALGFQHAPLVAWWLRFYARNTRFKAMIFLTLPMVAFLTFNLGSQRKGFGYFPAALGTLPVATFFATARFMVNQFGYLGGGYRRFFLLPVEPAVVLRSGSYASMILSAPFIPLAVLAWIAFAPVPFDVRQVFMLLASGITGLCVFHALGLWTTLYGPRRGNYNQSFGNDLSLAGNILVIGGVMSCLFGTAVLKKLVPILFDPGSWWLSAVPAAAGVVFYTVMLRTAEAQFRGKREQLMAVVEGKA